MAKKIRRGRFIVLDGADGVGKSTQAGLLAEALRQRGLEVLVLREPGGTACGEAIRGLLLEHRNVELSPLAEAFLFQAARAQLVEEIIRPALWRGEWVVCDRFTLSTLVYQGIAGGIGREVAERLSAAATGGLWPDAYLVLSVPLAEGIKRRSGRAADRMESKGGRFAAKVAAAFKQEARRHPKKFTFVDGAGTPEEVSARIWALLKLKSKK